MTTDLATLAQQEREAEYREALFSSRPVRVDLGDDRAPISTNSRRRVR
jgi:hypothetical protein